MLLHASLQPCLENTAQKKPSSMHLKDITNHMENTNEFLQFDVVSDDSDHHYLHSRKGNCFKDTKSGVYKAIMREWKILQQNLPETIYVRVYERRINLMRAVIIGAAGTPYHDSLFFFDILFPSDYPNHPPMMHLHSFGFVINPHIGNNGKMCLSLLNTWMGGKRERWDPRRSTILQVLVSIQGLVLKDKPFSVRNENVFINSLKISLRLLQKPPLNFQDFVRDHFRERAVSILAACNEYVNERVSVGYYCSRLNFASSSSSSTVRVSVEFKKGMRQFYPQLVEAFRQNGSALEGPVPHLVLDIRSSEQIEQSKKNMLYFYAVLLVDFLIGTLLFYFIDIYRW